MWRSKKYMQEKYGGSDSHWYKISHHRVIPTSRPTGGKLLFDEAAYIALCEASRVPSILEETALLSA